MNQKEAYNRYVGSIEWHNMKVREMNKDGTNWSKDIEKTPLSFKEWKLKVLPEDKKKSIEMANILGTMSAYPSSHYR